MGYDCFKHGRMENPFGIDTMQYREWSRGFDRAFYDNLKRVKDHEVRERSRTISKGEVQHV